MTDTQASHSFYDHIDRVFEPDYSPTDQDIIQCRIKTTGKEQGGF